MSEKTQILTIPGELMDLNTYVNIERANRFGGAKAKENQTAICQRYAQQQLSPVDYPVWVRFLWITPDKRKDPDNVAFAKKFIMDGLVNAGILENDGRRQVAGFTDDFEVSAKEPRVEVYISPAIS